MLILLYILIFGFYTIKLGSIKKNPVFTTYLLLYFGGMCTAFYLWNFTELFTTGTIYINRLSLPAILYHVTILMIMLYPLKRYEEKIYSATLPDIPYSYLWPFFYLAIAASAVVLITGLTTISQRSGLSVNEMRKAMVSGEGRVVQTGSLLAYFLEVARYYAIVVEFLFFYCICKFPKKKILILFLFLSSLCYPISSLQNAAREYVLRYIFYFFIMFILFKNQIENKWVSFIKIVFFLIFLSFLSIFIYISISRFGYESGSNTPFLESLLSYYGQQYIYFSGVFENFPNGTDGGRLTFPFFVGDGEGGFQLSNRISSDAPLNVFSTYIGSFVFDLGIIKALIPVSIFTFIFFIICKINAGGIFFYIYIFLVYNFLFSGMFFYNAQINGPSFVSLVLLILFHLILKWNGIRKNSNEYL